MASPCSRMKVFSRMRSRAIATAAEPGRTGILISRNSSVSAGTFSNSVVTAAQCVRPSRRAPPGRGSRPEGGGRPSTAGGTVRVRVEYPDPVAHAARGNGEHAAQLAAAQHAEYGVGENHGFGGSSMCSAMSVCAARNSSSLPASCGSCSASRLTAVQGGVGRPGRTDGEGRDRNTLGHLHNRQQRVHALQMSRGHRARPAPAAWSWRPACPAGVPRRRHRR